MSRLLIFAALLAIPLGASDNQLSPQEKAAGWKLLFDGKTFDHWVDNTKLAPPGTSFTIEDGCLKATRRPAITEDLFSAGTYADFELEWDWKISRGGNSGLKYRIQDHVFLPDKLVAKFEPNVNEALTHRRADRPSKGQDYVVGFEYQITDNATNSDAIHNGPLHRTAALYDIFPATKDVTKPVGEFNHSRLVVKGDHVEHWLNGVKVLDASLKAPEVAASMAKRWGAGSPVYELLVKQPRKECHFSLQNHGDEAWFKNIKVKRLE